MTTDSLSTLHAIADATNPERAIVRPCVGCTVPEVDPSMCASCYAALYPRGDAMGSVQSLKPVYIDGKLALRDWQRDIWPLVVDYVYSAGGLMVAIDVADIEVLGELVHIDTMQRLTYDQALLYRGDVLHILEPTPWPPADTSPVSAANGGGGEGVTFGTEADL